MFGFTSYFLFLKNKNIDNAFSRENIFLNLFKITFIAISLIFILSKMKKTLKMIFYYFQFLVHLRKYFHENIFKNLTKHIFITIFYFQ